MSLAYLQQESTPTHPDSIWALEWTSKNQLVSGSADGHLRVYDATELSSPLHDLVLHPLAISSVSTTADGSRALSTSLDGTVSLINVVQGTSLGKVDTGREKVGEDALALPAYAGALHPDSECFAWSGRSSKVAIRPIAQDWTPPEEANGEASTSRGPLGESGKVVDTGRGKFGMNLEFSPDGRSLALATETGHIVIIDTETQAVQATYTSHAMAVRALSWSPDSQWLFSGSDDCRIVLHDVRAGSSSGGASGKGEGAVAVLQGHQSWVLGLSVGPDAKLLGSGGADKLVKLWDIGQRTCVSTDASSDSVWSFAWQPVASDTFAAGKQFAIAGDDRAITLYRAAGAA